MTFNVFKNEYDNMEGELSKVRGATKDDTPTNFGAVHQASFNLLVSEEQSTSRSSHWNPELKQRYRHSLEVLDIEGRRDDFDQLNHAASYMRVMDNEILFNEIRKLYEADQVTYNPGDDSVTGHTPSARWWLGSGRMDYERYFKAYGLLHEARKINPELTTDFDIDATVSAKTQRLREESQGIMERAMGPAKIGTFTGAALGGVTDPLVLATLPIGAKTKAGQGAYAVLGNIFKASATEFAIASGIEATLIQPQVYEFKKEIGSPWGFKEAAFNTMAAGVGSAGFRFTGEATVRGLKELLPKYKKVVGKNDPLAKAVERHIDEAEASRLVPGEDAEAAHMAAIDKAGMDLAEGHTADVMGMVDEYVPDTVPRETGQGIETVAVDQLDVDAKTFQYKSGTDEAGVTERLQGVTSWDERLAGVSLFYEDDAGKLFVVDGHQRLGLAKRLEAQGHPPISMHGFRLRASDGVTAAQARSIAAAKNIAEGSGRALDAAKVLRETGDLKSLPQLPPRSALVQQAQGLARLSDDVFMQVVNDVIPERYGAILGQVISDPAEQAAAVKVLARTQPANAGQARSIVEQVRAAGFERTVTEDLFGEREIAESLIKEKAQVIDGAARQIRKDKAVFESLLNNQTRIETKGKNVLDNVANLENVTDAEKALQAITRLSYTSGPVGDALDRAARELKAGGRLNSVVADYVARVADAAPLDRRPGIDPGSTGRAGEAHTINRRVGRGSPVDELYEDAPNFGMPAAPRTLPDDSPLLVPTDTINTPARKALREKIVGQFLKAGTPAKGRKPVVYFMGGGGASGKGSVLKKLQEGGQVPKRGVVHIDPDAIKEALPEYKKIIDKGDGRAAVTVHEESSALSKDLAKRAGKMKTDVIYDVTLGNQASGLKKMKEFKRLGYDVRLYGVTVETEEALRRAVFRGQCCGRVVVPEALLAAHKGFSEGFEQYAKLADQAALFDNMKKPRVIASKTQGALDVIDEITYTKFKEKGNLNAKANTVRELRQTAGPGGAGRPDVGGVGRAPGEDAGGGAGRSASDPGGVPHQRLEPDLQKVARPFQDDPELEASARSQIDQAEELLARSDVDVPDEIRILPNGDEELVVRSGREAMEELDRQEQALRDLITCIGG